MIDNTTKWEVEDVPNDAFLYVRIHKDKIENKGISVGLPKPSAFKNTPETGPDLSSDWNKYSTPQQSREHIGKEYRHGKDEFKNPLDFFIVSFKVQDILDLDLNQKVEHSPRQDNFPDEIAGSPWNRSHCSIIGDAEERRVRMIDIAKWEIKAE
jgi:hypothetical protein